MKRFGRLFAGLLLALGLAGCEPDDDDVLGELEVTPANTDLTGVTKGIVLTAVVGDNADPSIYPLEWSVAYPFVGHVVAQSAASAAYLHTSPRAGENVITVRDQLGREGIAVVNWEPEEEGGDEKGE